jgi:pyrroloquinoline quinone biosynthesis protein B
MRHFIMAMAVLIACLAGLAARRIAPPTSAQPDQAPFVVVLGIAQDGGVPHAGCEKECCANAWNDPNLRRRVVCLAIVDPQSHERWMIEATPDFPAQLHALDQIAPPRAPREGQSKPGVDGILLTHGHIGHYAGLMHLGREVMGAKDVPVYAMPRMQAFLEHNGPWDQLVKLRNIVIRPIAADVPFQLNERIKITPFLVPHRDEYTETVGYRIDGPQRAIVFIPDIDKWEKWDVGGQKIEEVIVAVDVAYLDGTFYADGELPGRSMAEVPHPFIVESMQRFAPLPASERAKVRFIHLNHTNPALRGDSDVRRTIEQAGFAIAAEGERQPL